MQDALEFFCSKMRRVVSQAELDKLLPMKTDQVGNTSTRQTCNCIHKCHTQMQEDPKLHQCPLTMTCAVALCIATVALLQMASGFMESRVRSKLRFDPCDSCCCCCQYAHSSVHKVLLLCRLHQGLCSQAGKPCAVSCQQPPSLTASSSSSSSLQLMLVYRGKRKLRLLEKAEWVYQPAPFSPLVHQLSKGGSDSLGAGMNGAVF